MGMKFRHLRCLCACVVALSAAVFAAGCSSTPEPHGNELGSPQPGGNSSSPATPGPEAERAANIETLKRLWARGSGYTTSESKLREAQAAAGMQVFGKVMSVRPRPMYTTDIDGLNYQFVVYKLKVEKIAGNMRLPPDSVYPEGRDVKPGDTMFFYSRATSPSGEFTPDLRVAAGDQVWAAFDQPPSQDTSEGREDGLARAWTSGLTAIQLSTSMPK